MSKLNHIVTKCFFILKLVVLKNGNFWLAFFVLSLVLGVQVYMGVHRNGMFGYTLDDSYIHMAIAKNIANHGVWGITKYEFTAASSSILYSLFLALLFWVFGVNICIPFIVNWIAAGGILYFLNRWSRNYFSGRGSLIYLVIFIFVTPLPSLIFMGMEHVLHILCCLIFIYFTFKKSESCRISNFGYFVSAVLVVGLRYEGVFLVGITGLVWLLAFKRPKLFFLLVAGAALPISLFGIYSLSQGGFFLPNSLVVKGPGSSNSLFQFLGASLKKIYDTGLIYALLFIPFVCMLFMPFDKSKRTHNRTVFFLVVVITGTCLAHFFLARFGKPYRYGAYLVAMELALIPLVWEHGLAYLNRMSYFRTILFTSFCSFFLLPILFRIGTLYFIGVSMKNIRNQQVSMALFVHKYFPKSTIALNDIGAVAFYNDSVHIFDLVGLANIDVLKDHTPGDSLFLTKYTARRSVEFALVYPDWIEWLGYTKPSQWKLLGSWTLTDNYIAGNSHVGVFAIDPKIEDTLLSALKAYAPSLPPDVIQSGLYIDMRKHRKADH